MVSSACLRLLIFLMATMIPSLDSSSPAFHLMYSASRGFPGGSDSKEYACNARDPGSIPGLGRSPEEENGYPIQSSCLENSMDRGSSGLGQHNWVANSFTFTLHISWIIRVTIYSLDILLSQFWTCQLFHVRFYYCFMTCIHVSQQAGKGVWYSHVFLKNFPQFVVIHTVKGFSIVSEA